MREHPEPRDHENRSKKDKELVVRQLRLFLGREIEEWKPEIIIVHERKGTAILRALIESSDEPLEWPWNKVVSSSVLDQIPCDSLQGKRLLIFDDMMRTGTHVQEVFAQLPPGARQNVRVAIFAEHEESARVNLGAGSHSWFYQNLTTPAYQRVRQQIINMLQRAGSLMLDTEHIEIRLKLNVGLSQFVDALRRRSDAVVFHSLGDRTNITVYYDDDAAHALPSESFPQGCELDRIVKKCRIVRREGDEFAIIPICLPSVPKGLAATQFSHDDQSMLGAAIHQSDLARFYGAALLGSLFPLRWILRDLYASDPSMFTLHLPRQSIDVAGDTGYSLEHLRVMHPTLQIDDLVNRITRTHSEAQSEGTQRRTRSAKAEARQLMQWPDEELRENAMQLLRAIGYLVDQRRAEAFSDDPAGRRARSGLRTQEIFSLGRHFQWEPARISALFDILIDDATLVTRVEEFLGDDKCVRLSRTFKPDGEVVSELIRRYSIQWGKPRGL